MTYTAEDKIAELKREIGLRRRVYPRWIEKGKIDADTGIRQIGILRAILADYEGPELRGTANGAKD